MECPRHELEGRGQERKEQHDAADSKGGPRLRALEATGPEPGCGAGGSPKRARPRMMRSSPMIISATTSTRVANSDAASRSKVPRQMRKTPTVTVSTPKYWTVAKSVIVSIITTATPAASAGRSIGITTRALPRAVRRRGSSQRCRPTRPGRRAQREPTRRRMGRARA